MISGDIMWGTGYVNTLPPNSKTYWRYIMELTQSYLKSRVDYNPESGEFTWKPKKTTEDNKHYVKQWNGKLAGKKAGHAHIDGYWSLGIDGKYYLAHRLVFLFLDGVMPAQEVDHINGNRTDNRLSNLRKVSRDENRKNVAKTFGSNKVMGVYHRYNRWNASIGIDGKQIHLGRFDNLLDAVAARKSAEKRLGFHPNHGRVLE